jgi:hypothetical protein
MASPEKPLVVVDVDLTILDCYANPPRLMPGAETLLASLAGLAEVHLWSAGGEGHCREVANAYDLTNLISGYHNKPRTYPPQEEEALRILGRAAALQIDDDPGERVGNWPFVWAGEASKIYGQT